MGWFANQLARTRSSSGLLFHTCAWQLRQSSVGGMPGARRPVHGGVAVAAVDEVVLHVVAVVELDRLDHLVLLAGAVRHPPVAHERRHGAAGPGDEQDDHEAEDGVRSRGEQCAHRMDAGSGVKCSATSTVRGPRWGVNCSATPTGGRSLKGRARVVSAGAGALAWAEVGGHGAGEAQGGRRLSSPRPCSKEEGLPWRFTTRRPATPPSSSRPAAAIAGRSRRSSGAINAGCTASASRCAGTPRTRRTSSRRRSSRWRGP